MTGATIDTAPEQQHETVLPLRATSRHDVDRAGGKGANLGEMIAADLPVPDGFVVTAQAYLDAIDQAAIRYALTAIEADAANADPDEVNRLAAKAHALILAEDTAETSFAGMNETFTNVRNGPEVVDAVRRSGRVETRQRRNPRGGDDLARLGPNPAASRRADHQRRGQYLPRRHRQS